MTVKDLKDRLSSYPDEMPVGVWEHPTYRDPELVVYKLRDGSPILQIRTVESAVRDQSIRIRVTSEEKEQIESKAGDAGVSVGAYLRGVAI